MKVLSKVFFSLESQVHLDWLNPARYKVKNAPERPKGFFIQAYGEEDRLDGFIIESLNIETLLEMNPGVFRQDVVQLLDTKLEGCVTSDPPVEEPDGIWVYYWDVEELLTKNFSHLLHG